VRHYQGFMADSSRWERFTMREDDVVISTPSKCGTTWMQNIVGMLLRGQVDLGGPLTTVSPWLDMLIRPEAEVFDLLEQQRTRRFIKTHTPLDGLPRRDGVTYLCVARHPMDVAMSDRDHAANMDRPWVIELRRTTSGEYDRQAGDAPPEDTAEFLRWYVDNDNPPRGSGPDGLADYSHQVRTYWEARHEPGVHLFHYTDLWNDLDGEMRRVAAALGVDVAEPLWTELVDAATLDSMRARASRTAPDVQLEVWRSPAVFFRVGGSRDWASYLTPEDVVRFETRLAELARDAAGWALAGRRYLTETP
jgi:hypothetical protein